MRQLRWRGVSTATAAARCRPGGPWQQLLPGVYLLRSAPPTGEERLHAALLYASWPAPEHGRPVLGRAGAGRAGIADTPVLYGTALVTGPAALALHRFSSAPSLRSLDRIDVLVHRSRRLRSTGCVNVVRTPALPPAVDIGEVPVAPVPRALADTVARLPDAVAVRRLLTEAVRGGHGEATAVVRELSGTRLLSRPHVIDAVDGLIAEGRATAEGRLYEMVRRHGLPDPLWNVDLRMPGGPHLGGVDAYWPDHAVALDIDVRASCQDEDGPWSQFTRKHEHLERLGITVVRVTPEGLQRVPEQQAVVIRTALMVARDRVAPLRLVVLPR